MDAGGDGAAAGCASTRMGPAEPAQQATWFGVKSAFGRPDMTAAMSVMDSLPAAARELLQCDGAALRRRWESCQDAAALEAAIEQYKEALEAVLRECKRLGERGGVPFQRPARCVGQECLQDAIGLLET